MLGWMTQAGEQYAVTPKGQQLLATPPESSEEAQAFADALRSNEPIAAVAPTILARDPPSIAEVTNAIKRLTGLAYSTAEARAQTLFAWRRRILPALVESTQLSFPLVTPSSAPAAVLKSVTFQDWKSFREATLHVDELTILIGTNASGKSNALDG